MVRQSDERAPGDDHPSTGRSVPAEIPGTRLGGLHSRAGGRQAREEKPWSVRHLRWYVLPCGHGRGGRQTLHHRLPDPYGDGATAPPEILRNFARSGARRWHGHAGAA